MARGDCLVLLGLSERWVSREKRVIEGTRASPGHQVNRGRWVTLEYLVRWGHLDCKGFQGLQVPGDLLVSEDPKAGGVQEVQMAQWGRKDLQE